MTVTYKPVTSDNYGDIRWQWYVQVYRGKNLIWDDYYQTKPNKHEVLNSIAEGVA